MLIPSKAELYQRWHPKCTSEGWERHAAAMPRQVGFERSMQILARPNFTVGTPICTGDGLAGQRERRAAAMPR